MESNREIKLFYCYAREDKALRDDLELHLSGLTHTYHLSHWHDREIRAGEAWEQVLDAHLNSADLIFLLISPYFLASNYCYGKEMKQALARHHAGSCRVVPILLRPAFWENLPFSELQMLPPDGKPVTNWDDTHNAFFHVVKEISRVIKDLLTDFATASQRASEWLEQGKAHFNQEEYEDALAACEEAIRLDATNTFTYSSKGAVLNELKRYREALTACEQAIRLNPDNALAYNNQGNAFKELKQYKEALLAYEKAIRLNPDFALARSSREQILFMLKYAPD